MSEARAWQLAGWVWGPPALGDVAAGGARWPRHRRPPARGAGAIFGLAAAINHQRGLATGVYVRVLVTLARAHAALR